MNFASPVYAVYLFVVFAAFWSLKKHRSARHFFLLVASYFFYMWWSPVYALLLVGSSILDYIVGLKMAEETRPGVRKALLGVSLAGNLGMLALFKYFDFFAENINLGLAATGTSARVPLLHLGLPPGISFYTFQTLSYSIDIYRKKLQPSRRPFEFSLFVSFFSQLVAGPIVRAAEFLPQFEKEPKYESDEVSEGLYRIGRGLFKKVLFGDFIGQAIVDPIFQDPERASIGTVYIVGMAFLIQLYADFSAYSDIAIGSAKMVGFELPENFNGPIFATSPADFWRRWHISLSSWLRDYVYIPLGGHTGKLNVVLFATFGTFLVSGLWHGAAWNFVLFGVWHGVGVTIQTKVRKGLGWDRSTKLSPTMTLLGIIFTVHFSAFSMLLFRTPDMATLGVLFSRPLTGGPSLGLDAALVLLAAYGTQMLPKRVDTFACRTWVRTPGVLQGIVLAVFLGVISILQNQLKPFVYFQF